MKTTPAWVLGILMTTALQAHAAATPEQKCQAAKNQAAGKYAACRQNAEKGLAASGDASKYGAAITKCEGKFATAWQKATDTATAAGATCAEAPLLVADFKTAIDANCDNVATALDGGGLVDCSADLTTCQDSLATCSSGSATCGGNLTTCQNSLTSVNAGTAAAANVLAGKTFSSSAGTDLSGTAPARPNVNGGDGSLSIVIPDGFYSGSKTATANDSNLLAANIKSGSTIFGVSGSAIESSGDALAGEVLSTRTFSNASGGGTGSMPNNGAVVLTPGTSNQSIAAGFHDGAGYCAGDADLIGANIKSGTAIFGVSGTYDCGNGVIDPGEQCDQGNLNGHTCASHVTNSVGELVCGAGCMFDTSSCEPCGARTAPRLPGGKFIVRTTYGLTGVGTPTNIVNLNSSNNPFGLLAPRRATFDASAFVDPWDCSSGSMIYHWQVRLPNTEDYRVAGITGTDSPVLQIAANSIPVGDVTLILTVQSRSLLGTEGLTTVTLFTRVSSSALTLQIISDCAVCALPCSIEAARPVTGCI